VRLPVRTVTGLVQNVAPPLAIAAIVLVFLPLSRTYDLNVFLRAGDALLHGLTPYPNPASRAVYSGSSFVYPYLAAVPFMPLAAIPPDWSATLFFAVSVLAVLAACYAGAGGDPRPAALVLCMAFTITGLQLGALGPLLFAGTVFLWRLRDRPVALAALAGAVIASKLFLGPLLVWLLLAGRYRAFAYACICTAGILVAGFVFGPLGPASYAHLLSQLGVHEARAGFGLVGALMNAGATAGVAQATAMAVGATLVGISYVHWRRAGDERVLFCGAIVAALAATPVLWSHYLVLLAVPLLAYNAPRRWLATLALASWVIAPAHGVRFDDDVIARVPHSTEWAIAMSLLVFAYATGRGGDGRARAGQ
jgi:alpha-1,2-mannosyltransferase